MNIWAEGILTIIIMLVILIEESITVKPLRKTKLNLDIISKELHHRHPNHFKVRDIVNNHEDIVAKKHIINPSIKKVRNLADKETNQHLEIQVRKTRDTIDNEIANKESRLHIDRSKVINHRLQKRVVREVHDKGGHHDKGEHHDKAANDDEYTYEYETVEDEHPPTTTTTTTTTTEKTWVERIPGTRRRKTSKTTLEKKSSRKTKSLPPSTMQTTRLTNDLYTIDSAVLDKLQETKKKSDMTSRDREMAKRNLLRRTKLSTRRKDQSKEKHDSSGGNMHYVDMAKFEKIKKKEAELNKEEHNKNEYEPMEHEKAVKNSTMDKVMGETDRVLNDDDYTYEYETVEDSKQKKTSREISKELFEKQLADYHAKQVSRRKYLFPDESKYIDHVKVDGVNIKDIKDDTNETLTNWDEHGNLRWRKEWEHLKPTWTEYVPTSPTTTEYVPYASEYNEKKSEFKVHDEEENSDWVQEHAQSRFEAKLKEWGMDDATRHPEAQEVHDLIDNLKIQNIQGKQHRVYDRDDDPRVQLWPITKPYKSNII
ncbi:hypothetical protein WDU94_000108, partial [Cyamophila willieti]